MQPMSQDAVGQGEAADRGDLRLWGFLVVLWLIAVTCSVGLESRYFMEIGMSGYALALILVFFLLIGGLAFFQMDSALRRSTVVLKGKPVRVEIQDAPQPVAEAVRQRAAALGIGNEIDVAYLPRTWGVVDAYVAGIGRHQTIVMTGGLMRISYSPRHEHRSQFQFVVDHELGHIAHGDTTVLYLASATIQSIIALLPLKIAFYWLLGWEDLRKLYSASFPRIYSQSALILFGSSQDLLMDLAARQIDAGFAVFFILIFYCVIFAILGILYVLIVRRREFMADQFATSVAADSAAARQALQVLLSGSGLLSGPPHGFKGNVRWHPKPGERVRQLRDVARGLMSELALAFLLVVALFTFRIAFGVGAQRVLVAAPPLTIEPIAGMLVVAFGFLTYALADRRPGSELVRTRLVALAFWSLAFSGALGALVFYGQSIPFMPDEDLASMMRIERTDWLMLILSIPVAVAVFLLSHVVFRALTRWSPRSAEGHFAMALAGTGAATFVLWGLSLMAAPPLVEYRTEMVEKLAVAAKCWSAAAREHVRQKEGKSESGKQDEQDEQCADRKGDYVFVNFLGVGEENLLERAESMTTKVAFYRQLVARQQLLPPIGFFLLWQGPMQSSLIY